MHYDIHDIKHAHDNYAAYNAGYYNTDDVKIVQQVAKHFT